MAGTFKNKIVFGLGVRNQLNELRLNADEALKNLNLEPADFGKLEDIGSDENGIPNHFQRLSKLDKNVLLELDSFIGETSEYSNVLDQYYQNHYFQYNPYSYNRPYKIDGNLKINGRLIAKKINQQTFDSSTNEFRTTQITPSINSVWVKDGNEISFGGGLKIINNDVSPAEAKIKVGTLKNVKSFISRRFGSEMATHKIQVEINGTSYYMYAIKNNPFKFEGIFNDVSSNNLKITGTTDNTDDDDINYVITRSLGEEVTEFQSDNNDDNIDAMDVEDGEALFVYVDPADVKEIRLENHSITKLPPTAIFNDCTKINLSGSSLESIPNFTVFAPSLTHFTYNNSDKITASSDIFTAKFPTSIKDITIQSSLKGVDFDDSPQVDLSLLTLLEGLKLHGNSIRGTTPDLSETVIKTLDLSYNSFTELASNTLKNTLTSMSLSNNGGLKISDDSSHSYFDNSTFQNLTGSFIITQTDLPIPNLQNSGLKTFSADSIDYDGDSDIVDYQLGNKLTGCSNLEKISCIGSEIINGDIPNFSTNTALKEVNFDSTGIIGGIGNYELPSTLKIFKYSFGATPPSPLPTNVTFETNAFKYQDSDNDNNPTFIEFEEFIYKSTGIATGTFPQLKCSDVIDIRENNFTELSNIPESTLERFIGSDNNFAQGLNLDNLFGNVADSIQSIVLTNNLFSSLEPITTEFKELDSLNLQNAFDSSLFESPYPSPETNGIDVPSFSKLPEIYSINVSKNPINSIASNLFDGCEKLNSFSIDINNNLDFLSTICQSIKNLIVTTNNSKLSSVTFSTNSDNNTDLTISNFNDLRIDDITPGIREKYALNELIEEIKTLSEGRITFRGVNKDSKFADLPPAPTVTYELLGSPEDGLAQLDWTTPINGADRVIVERVFDNGETTEIEVLPANATTWTEDPDATPSTAPVEYANYEITFNNRDSSGVITILTGLSTGPYTMTADYELGLNDGAVYLSDDLDTPLSDLENTINRTFTGSTIQLSYDEDTAGTLKISNLTITDSDGNNVELVELSQNAGDDIPTIEYNYGIRSYNIYGENLRSVMEDESNKTFVKIEIN
jgi:hypothetical protein